MNLRLYDVSKILCFYLLLFSKAYGQLGFIDGSAKLPNPNFSSWLQKGVADMNNDGLDDIVRADTRGYFYILKQQGNGNFTADSLGQLQPPTPLSVVLGDVDNNGYNDILTGGEYNGVRIVRTNSDGISYQTTRLPFDMIFTQASAMSDINNDGLLDLFVCNDDSLNAIWKNNGNGNMVRSDMGFDFSILPSNKHSGNYGIVFTDFDNDGDIDAYISKCRVGVTDSTDKRRINQLFVNEGGIFKDQASKFGMADGRQSWITEFQDIDNDGDMDAFIANHHAPSRLMLNNGTGYFTDITASSGLLETTPDGILQAIMKDFDNDGYNDLIVSGMMGAKFFRNNGNLTFSNIDLSLLNTNVDKPLRSFAIGDLNHDGFLDIYASYLYTNQDADKLWLNEKNTNHFIALNLTGTQSNRSAVGAKIIVKAGSQTFTREVRAGESYGISNSLTQYIGIGSNATIEQIEVRWPSGLKTKLNNIPIDQFLNITEQVCSGINCIPITAKVIKL